MSRPAGALQAYKAQDYSPAASLFREALALKKRFVPVRHPQLAVIYNNLATCNEKLGKSKHAEELYIESLAICEAFLPPEHPRIQQVRAKLQALNEIE